MSDFVTVNLLTSTEPQLTYTLLSNQTYDLAVSSCEREFGVLALADSPDKELEMAEVITAEVNSTDHKVWIAIERSVDSQVFQVSGCH